MLLYLYLPVGCWTEDLQKTLPAQIILWFCDFLTSPNKFWGHLDSWEAGFGVQMRGMNCKCFPCLPLL